MVGQLLAKLKELGIENDTIVMYSTDNGAETFTWPDGGTTMFRGEKNTNWEGGYRVPTVIRWPGTIKPGTVVNDVGAHEDMLTTLVAAAGEPRVKEELAQGQDDRRPRLTRSISTAMISRLRSKARARGRARSSSTGPMTAALRPCAMSNWKVTFLEQKARRTARLAGAVRRTRARRRSPICAWIPSSGPKTRTPWASSAGTWSTCS